MLLQFMQLASTVKQQPASTHLQLVACCYGGCGARIACTLFTQHMHNVHIEAVAATAEPCVSVNKQIIADEGS
jgi:hypothetical protein